MSDANRTALRFAKEPSFAAAIGGAYASGTVTFSGAPSNNDTVTVNGVVYTFKTTPAAARDVAIGATSALAAEYLAAAINADPSLVGTGFYSTTTAHTTCIASASGAVVTVYARAHGTAGNSFTLAESGSSTTVSGANLSGGAASNYATMTNLRFNSTSLKHRKVTVESEEIRSDRTAFGMVKVGIGADGDIGFELHYGDYNSLIASALQSPIVSGTNTQAMTISGGVLSPAVDWSAVPGILGAKYVKLSSRDAANNGIKRVISISGNDLTLEGVEDEVGSSGDTIAFAYSRQGVTLESYLFEVEHTDSGIVIPLTGMCVNEFALTMTARAKMMARMGFIGYGLPSGSESRTDTCGNATAAASLEPIFNTTSHIPLFYINSRPLRNSAASMDLTINNNLRERLAISREGTLTPGSGESSIGGRLSVYFDNKQEYDAFLRHEQLSVEMRLQDADGNVFGIYLPGVDLSESTQDVPGGNQDIFLNRQFKAKKALGHDGTQFQCQIDMLEA